MKHTDPIFYVQLEIEGEGYWTVYKTGNKQQASALLYLLTEDGTEGRVKSLQWIYKQEGAAALRKADYDLEDLDSDYRAKVEEQAERAKEDAEDALLRVANAKHALEQAELYFHRTVTQAYEWDYSLREIAAVANLSSTRIHQILETLRTKAA